MSVTPQEKMFELIGGFWLARSVDLAAQLGLVDYFDEAPKPIERACDHNRNRSEVAVPVFLKEQISDLIEVPS